MYQNNRGIDIVFQPWTEYSTNKNWAKVEKVENPRSAKWNKRKRIFKAETISKQIRNN